jgi:hypothetical protein
MRLNYAFATEIAATLAQVLEEPGNAAPTIAGGAAALGALSQVRQGRPRPRGAPGHPVRRAHPRNRSKAVAGQQPTRSFPTSAPTL